MDLVCGNTEQAGWGDGLALVWLRFANRLRTTVTQHGKGAGGRQGRTTPSGTGPGPGRKADALL